MDDSVILDHQQISLPLIIKFLKSITMIIGGSMLIVIVILIPLMGIPTSLFTFGYMIYYTISTFTKKFIVSNEYLSIKDVFGEKIIDFSKVRRLRNVKKNTKGDIIQFIFEVKGGDLKYYPNYFGKEIGIKIIQKFERQDLINT